jgi:hypothetical protein
MDRKFLRFRKRCWLAADGLCIILLSLVITYYQTPMVGILTCLVFVLCVAGISLFTLIEPLRVWNEGHITGETPTRA